MRNLLTNDDSSSEVAAVHNFNFKKHGEGILYYKENSSIRYQGFFENDIQHYYGVCFHQNSNKMYQGCIDKGKWHGIGEKFDFNGVSLCKSIFNAGRIEEILLNDDQIKNGYSTYDISDKTCYVGMMKDNQASLID